MLLHKAALIPYGCRYLHAKIELNWNMFRGTNQIAPQISMFDFWFSNNKGFSLYFCTVHNNYLPIG